MSANVPGSGTVVGCVITGEGTVVTDDSAYSEFGLSPPLRYLPQSSPRLWNRSPLLRKSLA